MDAFTRAVERRRAMGLADAFAAEDRVTVKYSDFYRLMKEAAYAECIKEIALAETNPLKAGAIIQKLAKGGKVR